MWDFAEVQERVKRSRTTIKRWMAAGSFPLPRHHTQGPLWYAPDVIAWMQGGRRTG
jgi:predicted DNA-binding transcriptional regulator AlpA